MEKKKRVAAHIQPQNVIPLQLDATFFFERAVRNLDRYHYDKALKYFRRAVEYEPENPVNHCNMAGILSEMGNFEQSNDILRHVLDHIDPSMTECHYYMANNYANMENFAEAEQSLVTYLENDPVGHYLEESEEMMEMFGIELSRPTKLKTIKSREALFEHDKARSMLEEGRFAEAVRILEKLAVNFPDFTASRNNLALAYYYMGYFDKALETIGEVLEHEHGNLHALCNLAIFYQHAGDREQLAPLVELLKKTYPFHSEHSFKLATSMGILGEHETAYRLFRSLLKDPEAGYDPCLYHYTAVAACNIGKFAEAERYWLQAAKLDPGSEISHFYLDRLPELKASGIEGRREVPLSYHYHLPFDEQFRMWEQSESGIPDHLKRDPLVRSSFFWALRHGDPHTKLQVIQALGMIADDEVEETLRAFLLEPEEDDYLKRVAVFVLRTMGVKESIRAYLNGKETEVDPALLSPSLPIWEEKWQAVMETALRKMSKRYDMIQQHDLQTLWVEFLTRLYPEVPKINKVEGWAAALEYLTAKMHRRAISYHEVALQYGTSITTVSKYAKWIDETCGIKEKMKAIFPKFTEN